MRQWIRSLVTWRPRVQSAASGSRRFRPGRQTVLSVVGLFTLLVISFCFGRYGTQASVKADVPAAAPDPTELLPYSQNPVAYIYGTKAITREELGEYLIARFGKQRLDFLVNRKIIEMACRQKGIVVTDRDVEEQFKRELGAIGKHVTPQDFEKEILTRVNKTLYEWKEDVLRPKIAMTRYCQDRVVVTPDELTKIFEAKYGPKVQCRMVVLGEGDQQRWNIQQECRKSDKAFDQYARQSIIPAIAADGGKVPPIHRHFGDASVERVAFGLRRGEVSELLQMPDKTWIILKCDEHLPPDTTRNMANERAQLHEELFARKLQEEIPKAFHELRRQATPLLLLKEEPKTTAQR